MRKYFYACFYLLYSTVITVNSQSLPVIFGDYSNMFVINLSDTTLPPTVIQGTHNFSYVYNINPDGNGIVDLEFFIIDQYSTLSGNDYRYIDLFSDDSTYFLVDTLYIDSVFGTYPTPYAGTDTFTVVRPFIGGDTLDIAGNFQWHYHHYMNRIDKPFNPSIGTSAYYHSYTIEPWDSSDQYIGIKKIIDGYSYYGWVKVNISSFPIITIKEYALNTDLIGIEALSFTHLRVFPNPTSECSVANFTLTKPDVITINLMNSEGKIVKRYLENCLKPMGDYQIDLSFPSNLPSGTYYLTFLTPCGSSAIKIVHF